MKPVQSVLLSVSVCFCTVTEILIFHIIDFSDFWIVGPIDSVLRCATMWAKTDSMCIFFSKKMYGKIAYTQILTLYENLPGQFLWL